MRRYVVRWNAASMRQNGVPEESCPAPHAEAFQNWNVAMYKFCHIMSQHVVGALWELQTEIRNAKYETGSEHVKRFIQTIYERLCSLQEGIARTARARRKAG